DVAGLVLNLVVERIRPLVIDPTRPRAIGDVGHFADQVFAVLILQVEKILADQCRPRAMRDAIAFQVVNEWIETTVMGVPHRLIGNPFEGWVGALFGEHFRGRVSPPPPPRFWCRTGRLRKSKPGPATRWQQTRKKYEPGWAP